MSPFRIIHVALLNGCMLIVIGGFLGWQTIPGHLLGLSGLAIVVVIGSVTSSLVVLRYCAQGLAWLNLRSHKWIRLVHDVERLNEWLRR